MSESCEGLKTSDFLRQVQLIDQLQLCYPTKATVEKIAEYRLEISNVVGELLEVLQYASQQRSAGQNIAYPGEYFERPFSRRVEKFISSLIKLRINQLKLFKF